MTTPKRHNTVEEYPIATLLQHFQHTLTPTQLHLFHCLFLALLTLRSLAQTRVCLLLANPTALAPNTWRQRLKRFRQQPFPKQTLLPTLLRLAVEWLRLPQVFLALDATTLGNRWTVLALGVSGLVVAAAVRGNTAQRMAPADAGECAGQLSSVVGALGASVGVVLSCAGGCERCVGAFTLTP